MKIVSRGTITFGEALRKERDAMNWSREYLERVIRNRCRNGEHPITTDAIKAIELGWTEEPRNGTRAQLIRIFPKLTEFNQETSVKP